MILHFFEENLLLVMVCVCVCVCVWLLSTVWHFESAVYLTFRQASKAQRASQSTKHGFNQSNNHNNKHAENWRSPVGKLLTSSEIDC
jgi:hypothetical protein